MAIASIIIGVTLVIISLGAFMLINGDAAELAFFPLCFGIMFLGAGIGILCDGPTPKEPTALDVYRGNTTLEITYRDSIPIDSTVVFKK